MSTSDIKWISARVTSTLFIAAKTLCLQRGVSMQKFMRSLITKEVEKAQVLPRIDSERTR